MKQAEDTRTGELPGLSPYETGNTGGGLTLAEVFRQRDELAAKIHALMPRGAYRGAVKIGCHAHALRARSGLSQAELARRAGVSERSVRSWDAARDPARECPKVHGAIVAVLAQRGETYALPKQRQLRYRNAATGETWTGRGLQPAWLRVALASGRRLADFEV